MRMSRPVPAPAVCSSLAVICILAGSTGVTAQDSDDEPADAIRTGNVTADAVTTNAIDVTDFSLVLSFHGESDKPFYGLVLTEGPASIQQNDFVLYHRISKKQARTIVQHLTSSQFFEHARATDNQNDPSSGPQYLLRVRHGSQHYQESLHWGMETNLRLRGIRKSLEGDVAESMDRLLARLAGHNERWELGQLRDGLKSTLSSEKTTFVAGEPISVRVDLTNIGERAQTHPSHTFIRDGTSFVVTDDNGRRLPFVYWPAGLRESQSEIAPSTTKVIEQCDLSTYFYLRRPGRYHVAFRCYGLPSSNAFHFEVLPADPRQSDGDPMGKLLPLVAGKWMPVGSPNMSEKISLGRNRREAFGWSFGFPLTDRGFKGSKANVWLWLTEEQVEESSPEADDLLYPGEYVGKVSRWHMYLHAPAEALKIWPTVRRDLKAALTRENTGTAADQSVQHGDDTINTNRWGEERRGLRIRLAAAERIFASGAPIPIRLEAENVGDVSRTFTSTTPHNESLAVVDDRGRRVPYIGGLGQVALQRHTLAAGEANEVTSFDLSTRFYLRRPGKYSVTAPGVTLRLQDENKRELRIDGQPSPPFRFEITADNAVSDGDPIGRLLPLVKDRWWLSGSGRMTKLHPGRNRSEVNGCQVTFLYNPTGYKDDAGFISLWLTETAADEQPVAKDWLEESESLGQVDRWHVYFYFDRNAKAAWPTAKKDLVNALRLAVPVIPDDRAAGPPKTATVSQS